MGYEPHETLVAPARAKPGLLRLAAGIGAVTVIFLLLSLTVGALQASLTPPEIWADLSTDLATATTPLSALINLFYFGFLIVALWLALWLIHERPLSGLIGPLPLAVRQFLRVLMALAPLYLVTMLLPAPAEFTPAPNLAFGTWVLLLPVSLLALLVQTSAEELVFRGYLQSQLAARFRHPLIWIGLPSAFFALLHYDSVLAGEHAWLIVLWAAVFAAITADLTARSGTLGPAIAVHLANNFGAILLAAPEGSFDGLALYTFPFTPADADALMVWMPVEAMVLLCSWLAARLALRC